MTCTAKSDWYLPGNMRSAIWLRICASLAAWFWLTAKTMDLPISPLTGSRRAFSRKVLQKSWLVASAKKRFSNSRCLKASCWSSPVVVGERDDEALFGEQLGGDLGAGVHHGRVDQVAVLHAVEQGVAEGRLAVLAAEGAVGVEQQAALGLARVAGRRARRCRSACR